MAVNKCDITKLTLEQYNNLRYGITCRKDTIKATIENYIKYLNCPDFDQEVCFPDTECTSNNPVHSDCLCEILEITENILLDPDITVIYSLQSGDHQNCAAPITYLWSYNIDFFDLVSSVTDAELELKVKDSIGNAGFPGLEYAVSVQITDANGCVASKTCFHVSNQAQTCVDGYASCDNPKLLVVLPPTV